MFIQKLNLDNSVSYSTSADLQSLVENLQLFFSHIPVLTPYSSKSDTEKIINENLKKEASVTTMTPTVFLKFSDRFDCSHVPVVDSPLMSKFGFSLDGIKKPLIILDSKSDLPRLNLFKVLINKKKEEAFVALFVITEMFKGTVIARNPKKMKLFCELFSIDWKVISYNDHLKSIEKGENIKAQDYGDCLVFMDEYREVVAERIFVIGDSSLVRGYAFEVVDMDLSLAGKYKYRVEDVYRSLTPAVVSGKKSIHPDRFKNIRK